MKEAWDGGKEKKNLYHRRRERNTGFYQISILFVGDPRHSI